MNFTLLKNTLRDNALTIDELYKVFECSNKSLQKQFDIELNKYLNTGEVFIIDGLFTLPKRDQFLGKIIDKKRNYCEVVSMLNSKSYRISGIESKYFLIGDLIYFQKIDDEIHAIDYFKHVDTFKGQFLINNQTPSLNVDYLKSCNISISISEMNGFSPNIGDLLQCSILDYDESKIKVKIEGILVSSNSVDSDISMIIEEHDCSLDFPIEVIKEAKIIPQEITADDKQGRVDYTSDIAVTIDGDDARDFDDAVYCKKEGKGFMLRVYIADVTEYVKPHHPLDDEASYRGTSIYVADRVIPMLPFELSNGICSLNPNVERLVLAVTMYIDPYGNTYNSKVEKAYIKSHSRLTYSNVNKFFNGEEVDISNEVKDMLKDLHECGTALNKKNNREGIIDFDSQELHFRLDENNFPIEVIKEVQGEAEQMIEDLMIETNVTIASLLDDNGVPVLYRVHEKPFESKLIDFKDYLKKNNLLSKFPPIKNITATSLNDFLKSIKDDDVRKTVSYQLLRCMTKAKYSNEKIGHFGLSKPRYCHFTSPIRRYPDDVIHRAVKDYLIDKKEINVPLYNKYLSRIGDQLTQLEINSMIIEREVEDLESCKYLSRHIGEVFHGSVVSLLKKGMFIELENGIQGFLPYYCIDSDFYFYQDVNKAVLGKKSGKEFNIGSKLDVCVLSVNIDSKDINLCSAEFYKDNAVNLTDEEKETLSQNGVRLYMADSTNKGLAQLAKKKQEETLKEKGNYRPTKEEWKTIDLIRAIKAKYENEDTLKDKLKALGITELEYNKLLPFVDHKSKSTRSRSDSKYSSHDRSKDTNGHSHSSHFKSSNRSSFSKNDDQNNNQKRSDRKRTFSHQRNSNHSRSKKK